ncbi:thrombospondin type 1 domain-containing protein, partial [Cystoisospora suis]
MGVCWLVMFSLTLPSGVSVGPSAQRKARFQNCLDSLLLTITQVLRLPRRSMAKEDGYNESNKQWKFSIAMDPSLMSLKEAQEELTRELENSNSNLHSSFLSCMDHHDALEGLKLVAEVHKIDNP